MKIPFSTFFGQKSDSLPLLKRVLGEGLRKYWRSYAIGFFFLAIVAATTTLSAWIMRDVVNMIFVDKNETMLWIIPGGVILLFVVKGFATYLQMVTLSRVGNRIIAANQQRVFDHLLTMDLAFFSKRNSSDLIMRVSQGAGAARNVIDLIVVSLGRDLMTVIGLTGVMILQAPVMSLIALLTAPVAIIGVVNLGRRIRGLAKLELLGLAQIISVLQETSQGARIVKAFGLDDHMRGRMALAVTGVEQRANKIAMLQARTSPLMEALGGIAVGCVIFISGWQTISLGQTPGEFMSFITALLLAYEPAKRLARLHLSLEASLMGVRMMFDLLDTLPGPTELPGAPDLKVSDGAIEFRDVTFGYRKNQPVLKAFSFRVGGGESIALVGPSGGGKSTTLALVQRFYDVEKGAVLVDGQDVRAVSPTSLRAAMALVSQDTYLFSGSVGENIKLGRVGASQEEVVAAAKAAHADEFIAALPDGYDTTVGENGMQLSGGQRQRIAIARALLKDAPIILLDEATSSLDSETERKIQDAIAHLTRGRTTIAIAHRLSTVMEADRILVVEDGRIIDSGRHEELLRRGGLYERLCRLQFEPAAKRPAAKAVAAAE